MPWAKSAMATVVKSLRDRRDERAHGEQKAQRLLAIGLEALKVGDHQLQDGPKGLAEKQVYWPLIFLLCDPKSHRDFVAKPKVARFALPWDNSPAIHYPQRGLCHSAIDLEEVAAS